jgi:hypothetical protein
VKPEEPFFDDTIVDVDPPAELEGPTGRVRMPLSGVGTVRTRRPAPTKAELEAELAECGGSVAEVARRLRRQ